MRPAHRAAPLADPRQSSPRLLDVAPLRRSDPLCWLFSYLSSCLVSQPTHPSSVHGFKPATVDPVLPAPHPPAFGAPVSPVRDRALRAAREDEQRPALRAVFLRRLGAHQF